MKKKITIKEYKEKLKEIHLNNKIMYHASPKKLNKLFSNPMWFSDTLKLGNGWKKLIEKDHGQAYLYECVITGNVAEFNDEKVKNLFDENNIDMDDYIIELVENPDYEKDEVNNFEGTRLLINNGFDGFTYYDYDPNNTSKDALATIIFNPNKSGKIIGQIDDKKNISNDRVSDIVRNRGYKYFHQKIGKFDAYIPPFLDADAHRIIIDTDVETAKYIKKEIHNAKEKIKVRLFKRKNSTKVYIDVEDEKSMNKLINKLKTL